MEFLYELGLFLAKFMGGVIIIAIGFAILGLIIASIKMTSKLSKDEKFKFENLLEKSDERKEEIKKAIFEADVSLDEKERKAQIKKQKKEEKNKEENLQKNREKAVKEAQEKGEFAPEHLFVIDFDGDVEASDCDDLTKEINVILDVATPKDEVILNLRSPGGAVNGYGLCSSQLERLRDKGVILTACVDEVAASGGYLMACVANKIIAAPFSYIGSIGVVAQLPNFNKVLKKHDVEYEQVTAGKYKRTLTMFGENTQEGREKFKEELNLIHVRFKEIVSKYRPNMDIENIATGEFWLAKDAKERGLVDEISTFDAYLNKKLEITQKSAIKISIQRKEKKSLLGLIKGMLHAKTWTSAVKEEVLDVMKESNYKI